VLTRAVAEQSSCLTHCTAATLPSGTLMPAVCTYDTNILWLFCAHSQFFNT
jgi:hypothetical protein